MTIYPDPTFPLPVSDQADVIELFLELMGEDSRAGRVSEVRTTMEPIEQRRNFDDLFFPNEPLELD
jgi:hypothetical protein